MDRRGSSAPASSRQSRSRTLEAAMRPASRQKLVIKRRPVVPQKPPAQVRFVPPIRLRYVALVGAVLFGVYSMVPRAVAYWRLHTVATQVANYALCMVGPTGPKLLLEQPTEFWRLVRRRVVSARADSRPFAKCDPRMLKQKDSGRLVAAHGAKAREFDEYADLAATATTPFKIDDLMVSADPLVALAEQSRPFSHGYEQLVQPSRNARAVPHPVPLPEPSVGSGLPAEILGFGAVSSSSSGHLLVVGRGANRRAFRSMDEGRSWVPVDPLSVEAVRGQGQCGPDAGQGQFKLSVHDTGLRIESWSGSSLETSFPLAPGDHSLLQFSCDADAAVVATRGASDSAFSLKLCRHRERCRDISLPKQLLSSQSTDAEYSFARAGGTIVAALARRGIVRVVSSRDDGQSWTPPTVAYDWAEQSGAQPQSAVPNKLLTVDKKIYLYAGGVQAESYPLLISGDYGASWTSKPITKR